VTDGGAKSNSTNASAPDGALAVAYIDSVNGYSEVVVRTFDTAKQPIGGEIRVDYAFKENSVDDSVRVAINNNGDFAVVWRQLDNHTLLSSVWVETFDPHGNPIALNQVGESPGLYSTYIPDVAIDQSGNVTVSYVENHTQGQEAGAASRGQIRFPILATQGNPVRFVFLSSSLPEKTDR
jgi:hypothetical protein